MINVINFGRVNRYIQGIIYLKGMDNLRFIEKRKDYINLYMN